MQIACGCGDAMVFLFLTSMTVVQDGANKIILVIKV